MMSLPERVILVGASRFAEEIGDLCLMMGVEVAARVEGLDPGRVDLSVEPPVLWVDDQAGFEPALPILPAIGSVQRLGIVRRLVDEGRDLATLVHSSAVVATSATIGPGSVIFPLVVVGARCRIGEGTIVNRGSLIGHHAVIGSYSFLGPGSNVAGSADLGSQVYVGAGAIVRDGITIGDGATVGMGAVVVRDVPAGVTVVGVPARPMDRKAAGPTSATS